MLDLNWTILRSIMNVQVEFRPGPPGAARTDHIPLDSDGTLVLTLNVGTFLALGLCTVQLA